MGSKSSSNASTQNQSQNVALEDVEGVTLTAGDMGDVTLVDPGAFRFATDAVNDLFEFLEGENSRNLETVSKASTGAVRAMVESESGNTEQIIKSMGVALGVALLVWKGPEIVRAFK